MNMDHTEKEHQKGTEHEASTGIAWEENKKLTRDKTRGIWSIV
jgi:hypothetical protein